MKAFYFDFENPSQRNVSWAMQYKRMTKKDCLQQCEKINHKIPSIEVINVKKLESVKQAKIQNIIFERFLCV